RLVELLLNVEHDHEHDSGGEHVE
ncbi:MAG: hypothetical protein RIS07_255, partial [Actinomycetota bacterium]